VARVSIAVGKAHRLSATLVLRKNSVSQEQSLENNSDTKNTEEARSHEEANANSGGIKVFFAL